MKALIQREFWEHRGAFIKAPKILGIVLFVTTLIAYITIRVTSAKVNGEAVLQSGILELKGMSSSNLILFWDSFFIGTSTFYFVVLYFVMYFYMLGSLFDDRKDGSILFWKSLPVSDTETVVSKVLTAILFVPIAYTVIYFFVILILMAFYSIILLFHGLNPWDLVWSPAQFIKGTIVMFTGTMVQALWALPIYGWLMFCSAWFKKRPFIYSIIIPAILAFSWYWFKVLTALQFANITVFKSPLVFLGHAMFPYTTDFQGFSGLTIDDDTRLSEILENLFYSVQRLDVLYGVIFAAVLISISIWVRRYRNTT
ncbi:MAG: hypothetical protein AB8B80_09305 [Marinicellaceae bacterium]